MNQEKLNFTSRRIDEQYLKLLFKEYYKNLCLFARQYVHDNEKVEDLVQDVFLNIWEKGELNASENQVKNYLYTSVRNRCLNYIRDNRKFDNNSDVLQVENIHESNRIEYRELEKLIRTTIDSLPEKCREVFELSRFKGLKYQQIAELMGISVKTVEAQMSKALRVLRDKLSGYTNGLFAVLIFFKCLYKGNTSVVCIHKDEAI